VYSSDFDRWLVSCYFALTTMVTIGAPRREKVEGQGRGGYSLHICQAAQTCSLACIPAHPHPLHPAHHPSCRATGYGDITPVTIKEVGFTIIFEIVGGEGQHSRWWRRRRWCYGSGHGCLATMVAVY